MVMIGLIGKLCAGKQLLANLFNQEFDTKTIYLDDCYDIEQIVNHIFKDQKDIQMRIKSDEYYEQIQDKYQNQDIIILSLTLKSQIRKFKQKFDIFRERNNFQLLFIDTPIDIRFNNFKIKNQKLFDKLQVEMTLENFILIDDFINYESELSECINLANCQVFNFGDVQSLANSIKQNNQKIFSPFRPDWDQYYMKMAHVIKTRSNCMKRSVGAILVKNQRLLSTGYNGTPMGCKNCFENGCDRCNSNQPQGVDLHKCFCIHAEQSAILEAGIHNIQGSTIYTTLFPCIWCTKLLISAKVSKVFYSESYDNNETQIYFEKEGILLEKLDTSEFIYKI